MCNFCQDCNEVNDKKVGTFLSTIAKQWFYCQYAGLGQNEDMIFCKHGNLQE